MATNVPAKDCHDLADKESKGNTLRDEDYFMAVALLSAERSKDPVTQVGACIVDASDNVVGTGYNGLPDGCSDDDFPWTKEKCNPDSEIKHLYICHAEMNALLNRSAKSVEGCTLYCNYSPCWDCARELLEAGITKVVFAEEFKPELKIVDHLKGRPRIEVVQYRAEEKGVVIISIDFNSRMLQCKEEAEVAQVEQTCEPRMSDGVKKDKPDDDTKNKRKVQLNWEDYFMGMAYLASTRGSLNGKPTDLNGVYIVNGRKRFVGIGHDSICQGRVSNPVKTDQGKVPEDQEKNPEDQGKDSEDQGKDPEDQGKDPKDQGKDPEDQGKDPEDQGTAKDRVEYSVCHAITRAILDCTSPDLRGCTLYTVYFPCNKCAQMIIQSGMREFVHSSDDICPSYQGLHTKAESRDDEKREKERASRKLLDHARVFYKKYDCGLPTEEEMDKYQENEFPLHKLKKTRVRIRLRKNKSDKNKSDKNESDKNESDKNESDKNESDKNKSDKCRSDICMLYDTTIVEKLRKVL